MTAATGPDDLKLEVDGLCIDVVDGPDIVEDVSFSVRAGEVFGLVGESGCGKTSVAMALLGHARAGTRIVDGRVNVGGTDILALTGQALRRARGRRISYVPQDPSMSLSPRLTVGGQLRESMTIHGVGKEQARKRARELFDRVELPTTDRLLERYPFELSGGQQQRVLIAMALACTPDVVVLDEPTTGLDVTTQSKVLDLIGELAVQQRVAFVYVSHDLAVVQDLADRIGVMYSGRIVETGTNEAVFGSPQHPYTVMLLNSVPRITVRHELTGIPGTTAPPGERPSGCHFHPRCPIALEICAEQVPQPVPLHGGDGFVRCHRHGELRVEVAPQSDVATPAAAEPLLRIERLGASYGRGRRRKQVLEDICVEVAPAECVALVGESGSGKSTLGRCIAGLHVPDEGLISLGGVELRRSVKERSRDELRAVQLVFQNPDRSLNPMHTVRRLLERPLAKFENDDVRAEELLDQVQLTHRALKKYPGELSGGEKQRVAIARALAARPRLLVCDEITSALDVSIQATILDLLRDLRDQGLAMLFITHNLGVVRSLADRTLVIETGQVVESGATSSVMTAPAHPYTSRLLAAAYEIKEAGAAGEESRVGVGS